MLKPIPYLMVLPLLLITCSSNSTPGEDKSINTASPGTPLRSPAPSEILPTRTAAPSLTTTFTPIPSTSPTTVPQFTQTAPPPAPSTATTVMSINSSIACLPMDTSNQAGTVTQVIDGDTIVILSSDSLTYTVRYIGIDAPEGGSPFSTAASAANTQLVLNQAVILVKDVSQTDQYGRLLRYVIVDDNLVNLELVKLGYATAETWPPDVACADTFALAENDARTSQIGMWLATPTPDSSKPQIIIIAVDKHAEYVDIQNIGPSDVDLSGWVLVSERGHQDCPLSGLITAGSTLRIWSMTTQEPGLSCGYGNPIWNNSETDPAVLYNPQGVEVSRR